MSGLGTGKLVETVGDEDLQHSEAELDRAIESLKGITDAGRMPGLGQPNSSTTPNSGAIMNIPVELHAVFGTAKISVGDLAALGPGSTILLDRHAGDPVDIFANGVRIATGEMVLLDEENGRFGFRLVDILK